MDSADGLSEARGALGSTALANILQAEIGQGRYELGSAIPSEADLRARFGVGRYTVREAVRRLEEAGLVERRQGAATRVVALNPKSTYVHSLRSLEEVLQFARETQLEITNRAMVVLDGADAKLVGAAPGSRWLRLRGVRRGVKQNEVICHSTIFAHYRFSSVLAEVRVPSGPLYAAIAARTGEVVQEAEQEISAGPVPGVAARVLRLPTGATAIRVTRRYLDISGGVMLTAVNWHHPATFSYVISLRRDTTA
jgi:GntR family transcriptional regulator